MDDACARIIASPQCKDTLGGHRLPRIVDSHADGGSYQMRYPVLRTESVDNEFAAHGHISADVFPSLSKLRVIFGVRLGRRCVLTAIGFALYTTLITGSRVTSNSGVDPSFSLDVFLSMIMTAVSYFVLGCFGLFKHTGSRGVLFCYFATTLLGLALCLSGFNQSISMVALGVGLGAGGVLWGSCLSRLDSRAIPAVVVLYALMWGVSGSLVTLLDNYLTRLWVLVIVLFVDIAIFVLAGHHWIGGTGRGALAFHALPSQGEDHQFDGADRTPSPSMAGDLFSVAWKVIAILSVLGLASGILRTVTAASGFDPLTLSVTRLVSSILAVGLFVVWERSERATSSTLAMVLLIVAASVTILLPMISVQYRAFVALVIDVAYLLAGMCLNPLVLAMAGKTECTPEISFGLGCGITTLFTSVGFATGTYVGGAEGLDGFSLWLLALVIVYCLLLVCLLVSRSRNNERVEHEAVAKTVKMIITIPESEIRANRVLTDMYKITDREMDVLIGALSGRNAAAIAETLYLSEGTVRTHLKRIYLKLGVHSRSELRQFVEKLLTEQ